MFLIDTNVWLELLLEQEKSEEVRRFFENVEAQFLAITDFSLYSIGIILTRLKKDDVFEDFLGDTLGEEGIAQIRLGRRDLQKLLAVRR
ncbi:MAG: PIN domain-containing protein, partial [Candidatus Bipolaricaulota bacterium]|nr:PIN domain-containing protein [Candidatus Bipolaricaulota bacterium]